MRALALSLSGIMILGVTFLWRQGSTRRTRWWKGSDLNERAVLLGLPGLGLIVLSAGPLSTYVKGEDWKLWFAVLFLVGAIMAMWAWLFLPIPRWWMPPWLREEKSRIAAVRAKREDQS